MITPVWRCNGLGQDAESLLTIRWQLIGPVGSVVEKWTNTLRSLGPEMAWKSMTEVMKTFWRAITSIQLQLASNPNCHNPATSSAQVGDSAAVLRLAPKVPRVRAANMPQKRPLKDDPNPGSKRKVKLQDETPWASGIYAKIKPLTRR